MRPSRWFEPRRNELRLTLRSAERILEFRKADARVGVSVRESEHARRVEGGDFAGAELGDVDVAVLVSVEGLEERTQLGLAWRVGQLLRRAVLQRGVALQSGHIS